jgi:hypothetical protein
VTDREVCGCEDDSEYERVVTGYGGASADDEGEGSDQSENQT